MSGRVEEWSEHDRSEAGSRTGGLVVGVFLATLLWQVPIFDRWMALLDEGYVLAIADRINQGDLPYRDVTLHAPMPGAFHLLAWWFDLVGTSVLASRLLSTLAFAVFVAAFFRAALATMSLWFALALVVVLWCYRVWAFPHWQFYGYALMAATLATLSMSLLTGPRGRDPRRLLFAGLAAGGAIACKQDYGGSTSILLALGLLLPLSGSAPRVVVLRPALVFSSGVVLALLPMLAWYAARGGLAALYEQTVVYPFELLGNIRHTPLPSLLPLFEQDHTLRSSIGSYFPSILATLWWNDCAECLVDGLGTGPVYRDTARWDVLLKLLFWAPLVLPGVLLLLWGPGILSALRRRSEGSQAGSRLIVLAFAFAFLFSFNKPRDWVHLMMVYPATVLLPVVAVASITGVGLVGRARSAFRLGLVGAMVALLGISLALMMDLRKVVDHRLASPRAGVYADRQTGPLLDEVLAWVDREVEPQETLPVLPTQPMIAFLAGRPPAAGHVIVWPEAGSSRDERMLEVLGSSVDHVVFSISQWGHLPSFAENAPRLHAEFVDRWQIEKVFSLDPAGPIVVALGREGERAGQSLPVPSGVAVRRWPFREVWTPEYGEEIRLAGIVPAGGGILETAIGMNPDRWFGPPVVFEILLRGSDSEEVLLRREIDPRRRLVDRRWHPVRVRVPRRESAAGAEIIFRMSADPEERLWGWSWPSVRPEEGRDESS
jgi:hypothetical protein